MHKMAVFRGFFAMQGLKPSILGPSAQLAAVKPLPKVRFETPLGELEVELDAARAPETAANFLRYVDARAYDGGQFHRTVTPDNQPDNEIRIGVVQGSKRKGALALDPIGLERTTLTGLPHLDGTISMARTGPDSATDQFFICVGDQPELDFGGRRNPDGQGFAAFGRLVSGWLTLRLIHSSPARGQSLSPPVAILRARRL